MIDGAAAAALAGPLAGQRVRAMDEVAFAAFYQATARPVRAYLYGSCGNAALADDLLQEAFCRFLQAAAPLGDDDHRRRYLFKIAGNRLKAHWRRRRETSRAAPPDGVSASPETAVARRSDVTRALAGLTGRDRQMLWLAYVEGASHEEIAGALGLERASLKSMLSRARSRLAGHLRDLGLGPTREVGG